MRMWLLVSAAMLTGFAPAPFPKPGSDKECVDPKQVAGTWEVTGIESEGVPCVSFLSWDGISVTDSDHLLIGEDRITLQCSKNPWNARTWRFRVARIKGGRILRLESAEANMVPFVGIARLQGDVLRFSFHEARKGCPEPFGKDALIVTLKRHKARP